MKPTEKQKRILWICLGILAGSYVFKSAANYSRMMAQRQAYFAAMQAKQKQAQAQAAAQGPVAEPPNVHLAGTWDGHFPYNNTLCSLRLVLTEDEPGKYSGGSRFSCLDRNQLFPTGDLKNGTFGFNPDTADISGNILRRSIIFRIDQTYGTDDKGCALTGLSVSPFGSDGMNAVFQKGTCGSGHALMQKQPR